MLIYFVFFVCMNILMIRTEDNIIKIEIKKKEEKKCNVTQEVKLHHYSNVTLEIISEYFIVDYKWKLENSNIGRHVDFKDSNLSITYERSIGSIKEKTKTTFKFTSSNFYIRSEDPPISPGTWIFTFELLKNYDPWSFQKLNTTLVETWECRHYVKIDEGKDSVRINSAKDGSDKSNEWSGGSLGASYDEDKKSLIIVLAIIGALFLAQTTYIITGKIRGGKSNKNNDKDLITPKSPKVKRGSKPESNIADRPPLPLPTDEVTKNELGSPLFPMSPKPKRLNDGCNGCNVMLVVDGSQVFYGPFAPPAPEEDSFKCHPVPLMQKESHRNKGLNTSEERVNSPSCARRFIDGPIVPKHSYRHKALLKSNEEIRSPGSSRRHEMRMEGPLVLKQSYRNVEAFKISKEELRSPGLGRRQEAPLVPKKPCKNNALENSLEELRTPHFGRRHEGPLVPKQSYRHNVLDDSNEDIRTPSFARRQIEAILVQLPPKGVSASKSFKNPIPLPRRTSSPPTPPEKVPICPAPSKEPAPPLHPKKVAATFPSQQETGRPQDSRTFSDDEWQYEELEPDSKYLNANFTVDKPYT